MHAGRSTGLEKGFTLVESAISMALVAIIALGALSYEYQAARHSRIAKEDRMAARTAQLLLEDWKSTGGSNQYDPEQLGLGFERYLQTDWYIVDIEGLKFYTKLTPVDILSDETVGITLRKITVDVRWRRGGHGQIGSEDDATLRLMTYIRLDASGG